VNVIYGENIIIVNLKKLVMLVEMLLLLLSIWTLCTRIEERNSWMFIVDAIYIYIYIWDECDV